MTDIDVLVVDDEPLARRRVLRLLKRLGWVGTVKEAGNIQQAADCLTSFQPGLLLLDIQMPGGSGFDLVDMLSDPAPAIVIVTAFDDKALRAFDAQAVDYVTKPIDPGRFYAALERARVVAEQKSSGDRIRELEEIVKALRNQSPAQPERSADFWIKTKDSYLRVAPSSISHITAERDYVRIHADGAAYLYGRNLAAIERCLPENEFVRIHRSTIVRIDAVSRIRQGAFSALVAILTDGTELRIGRTYAAGMRGRLMTPVR